MLFVNNRTLVLMNDKDTQDIVLNLIEVEILNQGRDCSIHCLDNSNYTRMIEIVLFFHNVSIAYSTFAETDERGNEFRY